MGLPLSVTLARGWSAPPTAAQVGRGLSCRHALDAWWRTDSRIRHSYDLLRHTVGFLLKAVAWLVTVSLG